MNKKVLVTVICLALIAVMGLFGTMAYFTDSDNDENVFTFGNVDIEQNEYQRGEDNAIVKFEQNQNVYPAIMDKLQKGDITVDGYDFKIRSLDGNYVDKIVNVTNKGSEAAYVRTIIAIPSMNGYDDSLNASENPLHWNYLDATDFDGTGWDWNGSNDAEATAQLDCVPNVVIDGVVYDLYIATYNTELAAGTVTSPSMVGFYLDDDVDCDENGYFSYQNGQRIDLSEWLVPDENGKVTLKILVATQACQIQGFDDAWEALDAAFGDVTTTNHPWIVAE